MNRFPKHFAIADCGTVLSVAVIENEQQEAELEQLFGDDYSLTEIRLEPFRSLKQDYLELVADGEDFVSE